MCRNNNLNMPNFHKQLKFNNKVLQQLITTENSCVEVQKNSKHITLYPYHVNNISASIKEILNESIARYNSDLEGVLLGYKNIKLQTDLGHLNADSCFIHLDIEADFYIFKPVIGKQLPAVVTKKSKDHVGCLVYQTFNVSLPKPEGIENWTGKDVEIGQEVVVRITYSNLDERLPYIRGEFLNNISEFPPITVKSANKKIIFDDSNESQSVEKVKKKKHKKFDDEVIDEDSQNEAVNKKKKHKKRGIIEEEPVESQNEPSPKKKRKHKADEIVNEELSEPQDGSPKKRKKKHKVSDGEINGELSDLHDESLKTKKKKHKEVNGDVECLFSKDDSLVKNKKKRKIIDEDDNEKPVESKKRKKNSDAIENCDQIDEDANHKQKKKKKVN